MTSIFQQNQDQPTTCVQPFSEQAKWFNVTNVFEWNRLENIGVI